MPHPALILILTALALAQPAQAPPPDPTQSTAITSPPPPPPVRRTRPPPPPPPRIGVRLDEGPAGEWRISAVVPLSPAHRAGLRAGDLILRVRAEEVSFDDPERFRELFDTSPVLLTIERDAEETLYFIHKRVFPM